MMVASRAMISWAVASRVSAQRGYLRGGIGGLVRVGERSLIDAGQSINPQPTISVMIFGMNGTSMDLNAVRMLVQVAEARSFTVAAGQLGLSQSGLSRAIGRLEATLGVKLLQRNTRNVALTPDGRQFVDQVAPLLCGLEDAERQLADRPCTPSGTLKISAPSMFGRKVLVPLLGPLLQRHPQLQVEAVLSDRLVDLVEEGFDAALRTGVIADQRIVARPLRPLRWVTVASPDYLDRLWRARRCGRLAGSCLPGGTQPAQWPAGGLAVPAGRATA